MASDAEELVEELEAKLAMHHQGIGRGGCHYCEGGPDLITQLKRDIASLKTQNTALLQANKDSGSGMSAQIREDVEHAHPDYTAQQEGHIEAERGTGCDLTKARARRAEVLAATPPGPNSGSHQNTPGATSETRASNRSLEGVGHGLGKPPEAREEPDATGGVELGASVRELLRALGDEDTVINFLRDAHDGRTTCLVTYHKHSGV